MNVIHTTALTQSQKQDARFLEDTCKKAEPLSLSVPQEDGLDYFLCYKGNLLAGLLYLYFPEPGLCECCGFVSPEFRRQGIFSMLLDQLNSFLDQQEEQSGQEIDCCFLCDAKTASARAVLDKMGCEPWYSEYKMECPLPRIQDSPQKPAASDKAPSPIRICQKDSGAYLAFLGETEIGVCQVSHSGTQSYFFGFEIYEPYRGKGYGAQFLQEMMALLSKQGCQILSLQVSGENLPALSLYKKTGFRITETLSYYWY